jgi:hypothetical protein
MSLTLTPEHDNILRVELRNTLRRADVEQCQRRLSSDMARIGPIRLLIVLDDFAGWSPDAPWTDLTCEARHGKAFERIAIVGPSRWRRHMLMFAGADRRETPVEYFPPGATAEARAWLAA